jgi:hypothetical protein
MVYLVNGLGRPPDARLADHGKFPIALEPIPATRQGSEIVWRYSYSVVLFAKEVATLTMKFSINRETVL